MFMKREMILGKAFRVPMGVQNRNDNVMISGPTGSGKTRFLIKPNMMEDIGCSYVVMDPKGALLKEMGHMLDTAGYQVMNLDLTDGRNTFFYNPLLHIHTQDDIDAVVSMMTKEFGEGAKDPYWNIMAGYVLKALIGYLVTQCGDDEKTFRIVSMLMNKMERRENDPSFKDTVDCLMEEAEEKQRFRKADLNLNLNDDQDLMVMKMLENYRAGRVDADRTDACIVSSAKALLNPFSTAAAYRLTSFGNEVDVPLMGHERRALFITVPDSDTSNHPLASLIVQQVITELFQEADRLGGKLPVPVRFILDDFYALMPIRNFTGVLSTCRSRNISFTIVLQDESQLQARYEKAAPSVKSNCGIYVLLGTNDFDTAEETAKRVNCPVGDMMSLSLEKQWVFIQGEKPRCVEKYDLKEHCLYGFLHEKDEDGNEFDIRKNIEKFREEERMLKSGRSMRVIV